MPSLTRDVQILLTTIIRQNNEKEEFKEVYKGTYKNSGEIEFLSFVKKDENFGKIDYRIIIRPNKVHLSRSGELSLQQRFDLNKKTESLYKHPYGNMLMLTETKSIKHRKMSKVQKGHVQIIYDLSINDEENKEHHLVVTYMEEK